MPTTRPQPSPALNDGVPDILAHEPLPFEPEQGLVPAVIPDDPEHDRRVDPEDD